MKTVDLELPLASVDFGRWLRNAGATLLAALFGGGALAAPSSAELIEKGSLYDRRFEPSAALEFYLAAEAQDGTNAGLLVRIARQYRHLMQDAPSKSDKLRYGRLALEYSGRAAALAPANAEALLAEGITYGKMMPYLGNREKLAASRQIKASVDRALAADPADDTAWHILGKWQYGLADLSGLKRTMAQLAGGSLPNATFEEAAKSFERAISINPNRLMHYIELGRTYAKLGRTKEARAMIERGLSMPNREKDDPEAKQRGRETLKATP